MTEFIIAQSPHSIKGLMIGFMIASFLLFGGVGYGISHILSFVPPVPSFGLTTWIYQNLAAFVLVMAGFVMFVFISKAYKLRKRNNIVPYHTIAEDYFERNYELEQEYKQQRVAVSNITN